MPEISLTCAIPDGARTVVAELTRPGDTVHTVRLDPEHPTHVVIGYQDIRWPMDVAEWAHESGYAHDDDATLVIVGVQTGEGVTRP